MALEVMRTTRIKKKKRQDKRQALKCFFLNFAI